MEREKFEESWKDAFDKAEVSPSEGVWTNIELDLEKAKGGQLKKRILFYQMLAAASVVFAMAIGGAGYYMSFEQGPVNANQIALENQESASTPSGQNAESNETNTSSPALPDHTAVTPHANQHAQAQDADANQNAQDQHASANQQTNVTSPNAVALSTTTDPQLRGHQGPAHTMDESHPASLTQAMVLMTRDAPGPELPREINERALPPLYTPRNIALTMPAQHTPAAQEVDPVVAMLAKLEQREREVRGEEEEKKQGPGAENLWTSVGFAAGSFNTVQGSAPRPAPTNYSTTMAAIAAPILDQETKASGYSYSMGVNVGTRISERWVLQGGVNYLTQSSDYTANNVVVSSGLPQQQRFRAATSNEVVNVDAQELSSKLAYSAPYTVNNSMRYLSIPMQAGYLLVNNTFGLQLNAGVATDLFLQNTIEADSDQLDKTSQSGGADSPYRSVNLSGLIGTELSYRFSENYRVSLNPGIRYPFNSIYKSALGVQSTPLTFDIGLRFRYIFR